MKKTNIQKSLITRAVAIFSAVVMCAGLASCGENNNSQSDSKADAAGMHVMSGVEAKGTLGKMPEVTLKTPLNFEKNSYAILQKGNGKAINEGDRVCTQGTVYSAKDGKKIMSTWDKPNGQDCSLVIKKNYTSPQYYALLKGRKINSTIAFGIKGEGKNPSYVIVLTIVSTQKSLTKAEGKAVTNIPANLPKVTLDKSGAPSLDKNNYVPDGKLVSQTLIEGTGKEVSAKSTVSAHYSGWTTDKDGKLHQFDSSWTRGTPADFSLDGQVIPGWTKGLAGKKVGSRVLLVIPPEDGYGKEDKKDAQGKVTIPANSTLYFVVDILYAS
ncbi:FKBP-type peptidyl-prolyl cis-trans isomerase [Gardnerella vaginalis]|uniref:FKBP-type peptidyl-prolyl cis-trans isomerase n=1 Tax=Gardnerella vaginalis TaxID=2702 RepID=UPI0039F13CD4